MTELGQTRDPRALVPGDPIAVRANVILLRTRASRAERAGDNLVRIDAGAWEGAASEAFRERFEYEPRRWYDAANALYAAADALGTFVSALEWGQARAAEAIRVWDEAEAETARARQAYDQASGMHTFVDTGVSGRVAAEDFLRSARDEVGRAGDIAARVLREEGEAAPVKSGWLDRLGGVTQDARAEVINALASFGNAMVQHPGETAALVGGIALTAVSAGGEGLGFALDATGVGAIAGVPLNAVSVVGVVAGVGIAGAAGTSLVQHAAGEDAVSPVSGSAPARSVPSKTDRLKEHLTDRDLDAARRELNGEVVATKPGGRPWDHVDEVRNAQRGLARRVEQLQRMVGDSRVSPAERAAHQAELSEASRLLDHSEQFVPRI